MQVFKKNHFIFLASILIFLSVQLFAQTREDTLKQLLTIQNGTDKINTLIALSQYNLYVNAKQSLIYAEEALSLAQASGTEFQKAEAFYYIGFSKYRLGENTEAILELNKAVDGYQKIEKYNSLATARNLIAIINYYIGRYEISTKLYSENLVYYKSKNMMKDYSKMLTNLANVYMDNGYYDKALDNLLLAQTIGSQYATGDQYYIAYLNSNIGEAYLGKKDFKLALKYCMMSLEYFEKQKHIDGIANLQMDLGSIYLGSENFPKALEYYNLAFNNYKHINYMAGEMDAVEKIVRYYKTIKQPYNALKELQILEALSISAKDTLMLAKCYNHYADLYEIQNNYTAASKYFRKYFDLKNIIEKEDKTQKFLGLQGLSEAEEKDQENKTLKQENELQKERLKTNQLIGISIIGGLILVSVFFLILYRKNKNIGKYAALLEIKNEEINKQNKKLGEMILTKDKFFSILAHNLKNPFWSILGLNNLLDENYEDYTDNERKELISHIGNSAGNVYKLFENLLSWAKTQQSAITPLKENLNAKELICSSIKPYEIRATNKNVSIKVTAEDNLVIYGDKFMLETVIGNLVDNAIKFSTTDSTVIVTASGNNNLMDISIKDSGLGIPESKIEKLFKIDEDISSEGTLKERGTGLGLIICKEFIKLHNGEVTVESSLNEGTTFTIHLPKE